MYHEMQLILVVYLDQLCDLYENDSIFDKFECCLSGDGLQVATGSYRSALHTKYTQAYYDTDDITIKH